MEWIGREGKRKGKRIEKRDLGGKVGHDLKPMMIRLRTCLFSTVWRSD